MLCIYWPKLAIGDFKERGRPILNKTQEALTHILTDVPFVKNKNECAFLKIVLYSLRTPN